MGIIKLSVDHSVLISVTDESSLNTAIAAKVYCERRFRIT